MALRAYDTDGNGTLEFNEFVEFAASLVNTGPDQFFARMGRHALIETAIMPAAAKGLKAIVGGPLQNTPMVFLAPGLAVGIRALRGLLPF